MRIQLDVLLPPTAMFSYPVWIGPNLLACCSSWMPKKNGTVVMITDHLVKTYYALALECSLKQAGYQTLLLSFAPGEQSKTSATKSQLEEQMLEHRCDRNTLILAVGGGVVGDLAGFIAATYMRGIDYIHVPTTLLAMIDSAIGGKTGIDTPQGKNLIGAFWQPKAVIADITCLKTLSKTQFINGLIEAIKIFLTSDAEAFYELENHLTSILNGDEVQLVHLIHRAVSMKADIVSKDEKENHQRAILNFGHTIGHALEHLSQFQLLHGYAVALGLLVEAKIAQLMGVCSETTYQCIQTLLARLDITAKDLKTYDVKEVIKSTQLDKKKRDNVVNYVLLTRVGGVYDINNRFSHPVPDVMVECAFKELNHEWE